MSDLDLSIVICCFNSKRRIDSVLSCFKSQVGQDVITWEIVLVDNASTDGTAKFVEERWGALLPISVVNCPKPGLIHARSVGVKSSRGNVISFVDDDNLVCPDWLLLIRNAFKRNTNCGILGANSIAKFEGDSPTWFASVEQFYAVGSQNSESGMLPVGSTVYGAGLAVRRSVWNMIYSRHFTPRLVGRTGANLMSGEDTELCLVAQILGWRLYYEEKLTLYHCMPDGRLTWSYALKLARGVGAAHARLLPYFFANTENTTLPNFRRAFGKEWAIQLCYRSLRFFYLCLRAKIQRLGEGDVGYFMYEREKALFLEFISLPASYFELANDFRKGSPIV